MWRFKDLISMQEQGNILKKNKRKRSAKGEPSLSGDEESKTESSMTVKNTIDDKPLTIFGTVASRVIFQQKKDDTIKVIEQLDG